MRSRWTTAVIALVLIWGIAGGLIWWSKSTKATPENIVAYVEKHPVGGKSAKDRAAVMEKVARQLNELPYEQRREVRMSRKLDDFFKSLDPNEQTRFLDLTLPQGFKQMMESLNKMKPEERKRLVERTLKDMRNQEATGLPDDARERFENDPNAQKIIEQGLKSFYTDASAETKMDVAPILEQMQHNLQFR